MDDIEWLENDVNECQMMGMRLEWDEWQRMPGKWFEWVSNDGNEARMMWMTAIWYDYIQIEIYYYYNINESKMNAFWMMWMTLEWCEWLLNDRN